MNEIVASQLDFDTPLFGSLSPKKSLETISSLPYTDYQKDASYCHKLPTHTSVMTDSDSSSDSESSSESEHSRNENDAQSGSHSKSDSESSDSHNESKNKNSDSESEDEKSENEKSDPKDENDKSNDGSPDNDATESSSDGSSNHTRTDQKRRSKKPVKVEWEDAPDLYGIRRSSRQRKEPTRYIPRQASDSDEHQGRRRKKRRDSEDWQNESDSSSSSDSESFPPARHYNRRQTRSKQKPKGKQRGRRGKRSSYYDSDSDDRRHSRREAAKVSYKESSDDLTDSDDLIEMEEPTEPQENRETVEKIIADRIGRKGATGSKTTSYNCEDNADPNANLDVNNEETERQYLIKWKNWAHIHDTWETEEILREQKVNGLKKLDNWKKKEEEIKEWQDQANPEDIEYYDCQQEMMHDLYLKYKNVERIVVSSNQKVANENNGYPDYLVKWCGLSYSDCTWEDGELISRKFQTAIDEFHVRNKSQRIPSKICKALKTRPKFTPLKTQPSYIGGVDALELRDYQLDGVNWLVHSWSKWNSVILADEMGLGKTIQTIGLISQVYNAYQVYGPFLIVVPLSTLAAWQKECKIWAPEINVVVYIGDVASRTVIREHEWSHPGNKRLKFNVLLTTYEILLKDKSFLGNVGWSMLIVDEAHRLKNDDSLLYRTLKDFNTNHRLLITGTPLQNSLKELWALLHFIMPERIGTWQDFEEKHSHSDKTGFAALHRELEPYLLRRVKKDVEKSLPSKVEQILRVEMTTLQKQYYRWILTKNYRELTKGLKGRVTSFVNIIMELKKCCNHCRLTRPDEEEQGDRLQQLLKGSGKLLLLDKLLCRLKDTGHRVLIFSQMVMMLDILAEYMRLKHFHYQRLDGSIRGDVRKQALEHFNAEGSPDFCFLLSTRAGGLGINLATADTVIIFDSDWNPQNDLQAQARAHRIGQKNQVSVYRLITKKSVEEDIVERAKKKMVLDHLVIQRMDTTGRTVLNREQVASGTNTPFNKEELSAILKFGAEELFKEEDDEDEEPQVDIDEILKFAEAHETEAPAVGDELLSQFKVVSFDNLEKEHIDSNENTMDTIDNNGKDWDELIPEADRRKVEEEERQQQLMELHLPPRQRKTIQQLQMEYDSDGSKGKRRKKQDEDDSDASVDDDEPKKRGRGRQLAKDAIGFSEKEIRQFVKSYKKFINPITRLDAIACDAELQEKSESDLRKLAEMLQKGCEQCMEEHKQKQSEDPNFEAGKKSNRGPSFKIFGVVVNAQSVLKSVQELEPLGHCIPQDKDERNRFVLDIRTKPAHWDCIWDITDDSNLIKGVYEYGFGNWEQMKMDPDLNLSEKILPHGDIKPQGKHVQTRVEYLIKTIKASQDPTASVNTPNTGKVRKRKPKSRAEIIEKDDSDSDSPPHHSLKEETNDSLPDATKKKKKKPEKSDSDMSDDELHDEKKKKVKEKDKKSKKKKDKDGPKHFTASSEPVNISDEASAETLTPEIFQQCKEKMRTVKKSLKLLGKPDAGLSPKQQITQTRKCLLEIGDRISECLSDFNDLEKIKSWRNYLWVFVSQFTSSEPKKLHKIYKLSVKKREEGKDDSSTKPKHESSKEKKSKDDHHHSKHKKKESSKKEKHKSRKHDDAAHHNDKSHDSTSNGPHHSHASSHPTSFRNVLAAHDSGRPDGNSSPSDKWVRASPLDRDEDIPHKGYNTGSHSYNRPPHSDHRGFYGQQYSGDHSRFNNDRRTDHPSYSSYRDSNYSSYRQNRPDHRSDHRQEYRPDQRGDHHHRPEYGNHYRDSKYHRSPDDRRVDSHQSHSERKRKPEDYYSRDKVSSKERRLTNDPRLDPRLSSDSKNSYSLEHKSQDTHQ